MAVRNLEVSERRITHLKYELASKRSCEDRLPDTKDACGIQPGREYAQHWPGEAEGLATCRDVEHAMYSAEISLLQNELGQEVSNFLFYRRATELQRMAAKLLEAMVLLDASCSSCCKRTSPTITYKRRMIDFVAKRCSIRIKPAGDIESNTKACEE